MRVNSIAANNFLSFSSLELALGPGVTVLTGPNGAGKSNLGAAVALPALVVEQGLRGPTTTDALKLFEEAGYEGADAFNVSVGIEFDQPDEQDLVRMFIEACINMHALQKLPVAEGRVAALAALAHSSVAEDSVRSLFCGTLQVAFAARESSPWWAAWNFEHEGEPFQLLLRGAHAGSLWPGHLGPWMDVALTGFRRSVPPLGYSETTDDPSFEMLESFVTEAEPTQIDFGRILATLPPEGAFSVDVPTLTNGNAAEPASLRALRRALGQEKQHRSDSHFDFRHVLAHLLRQRLVLTDNRRLPLDRHFPLERVGAPVDLRDGSAVAAELHRLKNGDLREQEIFHRTVTTFKDITGLDLHLRSRPIGSDELEIDVLVGTHESVRIVHFEGAGVQEALLLSTLIAGDPGRFVVLDEPAVNLHPALQRNLVRHLADLHGVVITHSPDLVPSQSIDDLARVVRLTRTPTGTHTNTLPSDREQQLGQWIQKLVVADIRALLFASGVVLCEGATEVGALGQWWRDGTSSYDSPESANIVLIDVGGDSSFGGFINYLEAFGIPWAAIADGPAFSPMSGLSKQLTNLGLAPSEPCPDDADDFPAWRGYWEKAGVFTVADAFGGPEKSGEFEAFLQRVDKDLLEQVGKEVTGKPQVGAVFAARRPELPDEVKDLYERVRSHLARPRTANS
ncbi:AAA family ATPase [Streptomyces sp. NBC_00986]|uniref:AAA family ATPase n=1 Tax=Streptomyces sp. NBC_00986 TaxID=2903702 RepID=UPI003867E981|nr:AAA family ATPase [Streptomyces sp. NBC_00986]